MGLVFSLIVGLVVASHLRVGVDLPFATVGFVG